MKNMPRFNRNRRTRAAVLITTMLVLMGILCMLLLGVVSSSGGTSGGVMDTSKNTIHMTAARMGTISAFALAESGVTYTLQWLANLGGPPSPPVYNNAFAPTLWGSNQADGWATVNFPNPNNPSSNFRVRVYPDTKNADNTLKRYLIESIGTSAGRSQILRVYVQQTSFSKYCFFEDRWNGGFWDTNSRSFDGPVHLNNSNWTNLNGNSQVGVLWHNTPTTKPIFKYTGKDAFSVSGPSIRWRMNNTSTEKTPSTDEEWLKVAAGGKDTVQWNTTPIALPPNTLRQLNAALARPQDESGAGPSDFGVTVPLLGPVANGSQTKGGIYINGDVQQMTLKATNRINQEIRVEQKDPASGRLLVTTITLHAETNKTIVQVQKETVGGTLVLAKPTLTFNGLTNGVVYANGNIGGMTDPRRGGVSGVIADNKVGTDGSVLRRNALTIATPEDRDMNLNGNITYLTARAKYTAGDPPPPGSDAVVGDHKPIKDDPTFKQNAGTLGLVAQDVKVLDTDTGGSLLRDIEVDAAVFASQTYDVYNSSTRPVGKFLNMGSYIQRQGGSINRSDSSGNLLNGMRAVRMYDERLANNPPPFFPTTDNLYDVLSWQQVAGPLK